MERGRKGGEGTDRKGREGTGGRFATREWKWEGRREREGRKGRGRTGKGVL